MFNSKSTRSSTTVTTIDATAEANKHPHICPPPRSDDPMLVTSSSDPTNSNVIHSRVVHGISQPFPIFQHSQLIGLAGPPNQPLPQTLMIASRMFSSL